VCDRIPKGRQTACAVALARFHTLADCARQRPRPHHRFSIVENLSHRPPAPTWVQASLCDRLVDTQGRQTARAVAPTRCRTLADCARQPVQPPSPFPDGRQSAASVPRNDACKHLCDSYPRSANCPRRCCPTLSRTVRVSRRSPRHRFVGGRKSVPSTARANMRASIGVTGDPGSANGTCWPESVDRWAPVSIATSRVDHTATRWPTVHLHHSTKSVRETRAKVSELPAPSHHRSPTLSQTVRGSQHTPITVSRCSKIDPVDHPRHFRTS
jgi:hypothetical protein